MKCAPAPYPDRRARCIVPRLSISMLHTHLTVRMLFCRYERPFLHAPYPHDPTSSLAHTVTGDYASPATWGEIYRNKESIDWCTENFAWFEDRIKCIRKIHAQGPILG